MISPVNPYDEVGLTRIPREIRSVVIASALSPDALRLSIVCNMAHGGDIVQGQTKLLQVLTDSGIESLMVNTALPHGTSQTPPILLDDAQYLVALTNLLREIGL